MHFLRSIGGLLFLLLAALSVASAGYQIRSETSGVIRSWPDIEKRPQMVHNETSPSDLDMTLESPLVRFLSAANGLVVWLVLAGVLFANATLLGLVNVLDRGS